MRIVYVDGFRIKNVFGDMNFNLLGRNPDWDHHWYIPPHEIWIEKRAKKETHSLVASDDLERKIDRRGEDCWEARKRFCRLNAISLDGLTVKKRKTPGFLIRRVRGNLVRKLLDYSFVVGGHHEIYPWYIPKNEIWLDNAVDPAEEKYILVHEATEFLLMKKGMGYYKAHYNYACVAEKEARARDGIAYYPAKNPIEPLPYMRSGSGKKRILVVSGIHGEEPSGPYAIAKFLLGTKKIEKAQIDFIPLVNPDGFKRGTRSTKNGRDLNRWFFDKPKRREPMEVKILRKYFVRIKKPYDLLISLHEDPERKEFYLYDIGNGRNSAIIRKVFKTVKEAGIQFYSGIDDIELKNFAIDGYIPTDPKSRFPTLEEYLSRNRKIRRGLIIEVPGKLELEKKIELAKEILWKILEII